MLLWDIIRDWFVMHIWGGVSSGGLHYSCSIGDILFSSADGSYVELSDNNTPFLHISDVYYGAQGSIDIYEHYYMSFGDWLSTTSTIIVLILLCIVFGLMVRWLFRLTAGLIRGRG